MMIYCVLFLLLLRTSRYVKNIWSMVIAIMEAPADTCTCQAKGLIAYFVDVLSTIPVSDLELDVTLFIADLC